MGAYGTGFGIFRDAYTGGGDITGSGTAPKIPKFTGGTVIGDSQMSDNGVTVFVGATATSASALFEVNSTTQGFLAPRMTAAQRTAIGTPATGLLVYQTNATAGYYYYDGSSWQIFTSGATDTNIYNTNGSLTAARTVTLNAFNLAFTGSAITTNIAPTGYVGIENATPNSPLHVGANAGTANRDVAYISSTITPIGFGSQLSVRDGVINSAIANNASIVYVNGTINKAASGTHPIISGLRIDSPLIGAGGSSVTSSATLYIGGAPTGAVGSSNHAFRVNTGNSYFGGNVGIGILSPTARTQSRGTGITSATSALLVDNASGTLTASFRDDNTTILNGHVSIGVGTLPSAANVLAVTETKTTAGALNGVSGGTIISPALAGIYNSAGVQGSVAFSGSGFNAGSTLVGATHIIAPLGAGAGSATLDVIASSSIVFNTIFSSSTMNNVYGYRSLIGSPLFGSGTSSITNAYNFYAMQGTSTGMTVANMYGVYIEALTYGTANYGIISLTNRNGFGTATPDNSSIVEMASTTKGFLPPRMTTAQRDAITLPAKGLIIYNTTTDQWEGNSGTAATPAWSILG